MVHYPGAVLISMILPGVLSLLPLFTDATGGSMVIQIVGSLIFYSFLLMPAALRFDFRRDVDRMAVLKSLPLSPLAITVGQLAAPIVACTLFQLVVVCVALAVRPFPVSWLVLTLLILLPANTLIFALENLIFLLYPYRPNQEGVGVFLRSILTFTAKGVLFFIAVLVTWACVSGAAVCRVLFDVGQRSGVRKRLLYDRAVDGRRRDHGGSHGFDYACLSVLRPQSRHTELGHCQWQIFGLMQSALDEMSPHALGIRGRSQVSFPRRRECRPPIH